MQVKLVQQRGNIKNNVLWDVRLGNVPITDEKFFAVYTFRLCKG